MGRSRHTLEPPQSPGPIGGKAIIAACTRGCHLRSQRRAESDEHIVTCCREHPLNLWTCTATDKRHRTREFVVTHGQQLLMWTEQDEGGIERARRGLEPQVHMVAGICREGIDVPLDVN